MTAKKELHILRGIEDSVSTQKDKIDSIQRIVTLLEFDRVVPNELFAEYRDTKNSPGDQFLDSEYHFKKAINFIAENKISQALCEFEPVVLKYPFSINVQEMWSAIMSGAEECFAGLAGADPFHPEISVAFADLNRLGRNSANSLLLVLRHYVRTKKFDLAIPLATNLLIVSPNLPALKSLAKEILTEISVPEIQSMIEEPRTIYELKIIRRDLNHESAAFLWQQFQKAQAYFSEGRFEECLECCRLVLPKDSDFDLSYIDFYYLEASCLDMTGKTFESLNKFYRVSLAAPNWIYAHRALKTVIKRATTRFLADFEKESSIETLEKFYNAVSSIGHVPRPITFLYLENQKNDRRNHPKIVKILKAMDQIYPYDVDVISELLKIGYQIDNLELVHLGNKRQDEVLSLRPWDLEARSRLCIKMAA